MRCETAPIAKPSLGWVVSNLRRAVTRAKLPQTNRRRLIPMRLFSLSATALMLVLCGSVLAQQPFLVQHNDKDDPCRRFKMRIVIPANVDDHLLPAKRFTGGIDAGMVWNPCTNGEPQIAMFFSNSAPDGTTVLPSKSPFSSQSLTGENRQRKPEEVLLGSPASTFPFPKRHP